MSSVATSSCIVDIRSISVPDFGDKFEPNFVRPSVDCDTSAFYSPRSTSAASDSECFCSDDDSASLPSSHEDGMPLRRSSLHKRLSSIHSDGHSTNFGSSPATSSVDSASSDSELGDDEPAEEPDVSGAFLVYPIMMLLSLRAAAVRQQMPLWPSQQGCRPCSFLGYTVAKIPSDVHSPSFAAKASAPPVSWSSNRPSCQAAAADDKFIRTARSILNKLTIEKFDSLYEQLVNSGIQTVSHIKCLMHEVFEKATVQHHFIPMYADLCVRLESDARIMPAMASEGHPDCFKMCLLNRCQEAFESLLKSGSAGCDDCDDDEAKLLRKQRALGNVKFVGQLLVCGMLSSRLLLQCAQELLSAHGQCAEALESLAALLTVAAPAFDTPDWSHQPQLDSIFRQLSDLTRDKSVVTRERFLLRDVLDARAAGWPARTCAAKPSAPMRLEEVRVAAGVEASPAKATPSSKRDRFSTDKWSKSPAASPAVVPRRRAQTDSMSGCNAAARLAAAMGSATETPAKRPVRGAGVAQASPVVSPTAVPVAQAPAQKPPAPAETPAAFEPRAFRKVLTATMKELAQGCSVPTAVQRIRAQGVPKERQAAEFADLLTRACEEPRGPLRRSTFAFAAGLCAAAGSSSAFEHGACLEGVATFFREVFEGLQEEVPRLPAIVEAELLPTLRSVLPAAELCALTPPRLWKA